MQVVVIVFIAFILSATEISARFISDNICLAMPNGQKLPITDDCGSYIVCEYNVQKVQRCAYGTLFDPISMVCNWASFVKCGQTPSLPPIILAPSSTSVAIPTTFKPPAGFPSIPTAPTPLPTTVTVRTTTNNPYEPPYIPTAPTASPTLRPPVVVTSIPTIRPTTTTRPVITTTPPFKPPMNPYPFCTPEEFSFIAHPTACESYYICAYGKLILHSCGHGVYWNTATNQCDFPENTDCTNLPNPAAPETSTPSAETTTISSTPDCYGSNIFYPNYNDCSQYYICIGLQPILMSCPTSYLWNSKTSQCDQPGNAVCAQK
ncbi:probable chitinase 10 [Anopheles arabiensis]|uniref:Chitin-binding type-2 domain-containing protein n=1 Tax=Anopheles arabiensis TaxID=7173 RepID=A0A2C9GRG0_ANOAR|nr:probable chitinase 10 [Anopheles arabiensis]